MDVDQQIRLIYRDLLRNLFETIDNGVNSLLINDINQIYDVRVHQQMITDCLNTIGRTLVMDIINYGITLMLLVNRNIIADSNQYQIENELEQKDRDQNIKIRKECILSNVQKYFEYLEAEQKQQLVEKELSIYGKLLEQHKLICTAHYWCHQQQLSLIEMKMDREELNDDDESEVITSLSTAREILDEIKNEQNHYLFERQEFITTLKENQQLLANCHYTILRTEKDIEQNHKYLINVIRDIQSDDSYDQQSQGDNNTNQYNYETDINEWFALLKNNFAKYDHFVEELIEHNIVLLRVEEEIYVSRSMQETLSVLTQQYIRKQEIVKMHENAIGRDERELVKLWNAEECLLEHGWLEKVTLVLEETMINIQKEICRIAKENDGLVKMLKEKGQQIQVQYVI